VEEELEKLVREREGEEREEGPTDTRAHRQPHGGHLRAEERCEEEGRGIGHGVRPARNGRGPGAE
jgi:hypothetical protein